MDKEELKAMIKGIIVICIAVLVGAGMGYLLESSAEPEIQVVGKVFFDNPEYGVIGGLDYADYPAGAGVVIGVRKWNESDSWELITKVTPDKQGIYRFSVLPGEYSFQIEKQPHIMSAYPYTAYLFTGGYLIIENESGPVVIGPMIFCYSQQTEMYGLG